MIQTQLVGSEPHITGRVMDKGADAGDGKVG